MRIAIDLLWVRVGKVGGTESYIRSILDAMITYDNKNSYILLVSEDNAYSFLELGEYTNIEIKVCHVKSATPWRRIMWENLSLHKVLKTMDLDLIFIPIYFKPFLYKTTIPCVCTIHDLQAIHYPEYFSFLKRLFLLLNWSYTCRSADYILTDSNYCKQDIILHFPTAKAKVETVYVPVPKSTHRDQFSTLKDRYQIEHHKYFYTVSSLLPHKNLETIFRVMKEYHSINPAMKLVISGVGGQEKKVLDLITELGIKDSIVFTGFISDEERDSLYQHSFLFLFPSIFEGFGIPPIEALQFGVKTIMTSKSCLYETSKGYAYYVEDAKSVEDWLSVMEQASTREAKVFDFPEYQGASILNQLLTIFQNVINKKSKKESI